MAEVCACPDVLGLAVHGADRHDRRPDGTVEHLCRGCAPARGQGHLYPVLPVGHATCARCGTVIHETANRDDDVCPPCLAAVLAEVGEVAP